jgi:hypothetical protein
LGVISNTAGSRVTEPTFSPDGWRTSTVAIA